MIIYHFTFLILLLFLSAFFSSVETAFFSISNSRIRHIAKKKHKSSILIKHMKDNPHKLLSTILIGNNTVNVAASAIATSITIELSTPHAIGISVALMTCLILIFGEAIPKSFATRNNILVAKITIFPLYWFSIIVHPIVLFLNFIPKITGKLKKSPSVTEAELITFVETVKRQGEIKEEEKNLINNIFEFDDTSASEILTPRTDMFVVDINEKPSFKKMARSGFTRIPIINDSIDHVIGILNIKDVFLHKATSTKPINIQCMMREPYFVPENKKLDKLLHQFKIRKNHMAITVDEHGGISGLITLEDTIEKLVGEIHDETDTEEPYLLKKKSNEWIVLGKADINDVNKKIKFEIPESKKYDTFSGFILDTIGKIPKVSNNFIINGYRVTINEMDGNRIKKYTVILHQ